LPRFSQAPALRPFPSFERPVVQQEVALVSGAADAGAEVSCVVADGAFPSGVAEGDSSCANAEVIKANATQPRSVVISFIFISFPFLELLIKREDRAAPVSPTLAATEHDLSSARVIIYRSVLKGELAGQAYCGALKPLDEADKAD
jgi:hypothetical protein